MLRALAVAVLVAGCGPASPAGDGGPGAGLLCTDGHIVPICRCTSSPDTECKAHCYDAITAGAAECKASHGDLDGGYRFDITCKTAPSCG